MSQEKKTLLVVDDEPKIQEVVAALLESRGYQVLTAGNGRQALELFTKNNIALILLDLMLPDISGEEVCTKIRRESRVPILMMTAKADESSHLNGLLLGADDYITKPFSLKILAAHVAAILRRTETASVPLAIRSSWHDGDLMVDFEKDTVIRQGNELALTPSELKILTLLIRYPGKVFTREELIASVFGDQFSGFDRVIDNHIKNLRQKIEDDTRHPVYILTVHGLGYKFGGS